ncbi:thioredoxin fold domain-containing protein [Piscinibacter sakaiensis]|uniref:Disulfide isomerase n=1 Tax=Piscinibacter sakaiensis TaxID=1547922 RepID=A0A0K8NXE1_PISS1|nr:thioredoxin fold domain-containing protein [Piscinibacter sakaiensis]GAP35067.1 disulfide isomerase [Piscinibacter sakaiensis]
MSLPTLPASLRPAAWLIALAAACGAPAQAAPAPSGAGAAPAAAAAEADGIAWVQAASEADVDAAFARAKAENKPLFLYWGAKWCPPCNQVKATLFTRQDFIARSRAFVPVYVDGDRPGAQKIGARFKVTGYPTMVLFKADGREITRLPGEVDPAQYTTVLTLGMHAQRPVKAVLADARQGGRRLADGEWRMLAYYAWDTDDRQGIAKEEVPAVLRQLAANCPPKLADTAQRLLLQSLAAADGKTPADAATRARVMTLLADPAQVRQHGDVLSNQAAEITRALTAAAELLPPRGPRRPATGLAGQHPAGAPPLAAGAHAGRRGRAGGGARVPVVRRVHAARHRRRPAGAGPRRAAAGAEPGRHPRGKPRGRGPRRAARRRAVRARRRPVQRPGRHPGRGGRGAGAAPAQPA